MEKRAAIENRKNEYRATALRAKALKQRIYVLGNEIVHEDSSALSLLPELIQFFSTLSFVPLDPTEGLPEDDPSPIFIDTIHGITKITVYDSLKPFAPPPRFTAHDYDLFEELSLAHKLEKIQHFTIIGVPEVIDNNAEKKLFSFLKKLPNNSQ